MSLWQVRHQSVTMMPTPRGVAGGREAEVNKVVNYAIILTSLDTPTLNGVLTWLALGLHGSFQDLLEPLFQKLPRLAFRHFR